MRKAVTPMFYQVIRARLCRSRRAYRCFEAHRVHHLSSRNLIRRKNYSSSLVNKHTSTKGRVVESAGMPFGIADGKSQMPNLKSEICDLKFRAPARTDHCPCLEGLVPWFFSS